MMTNMKRISISIPGSLDEKILALRKTDRFVRCSYSEIARKLLERGLDPINAERAAQDSA